MARPKEKDSESCNLKLEVDAKINLTALAAFFKTSRTKVVEELVNKRHAEVFGGASSSADSNQRNSLDVQPHSIRGTLERSANSDSTLLARLAALETKVARQEATLTSVSEKLARIGKLFG